jgi:hypothetical protein
MAIVVSSLPVAAAAFVCGAVLGGGRIEMLKTASL